MKRTDTRRQERLPSSAKVKVRWNGAAGDAHFARGTVVNCSSTGICVELVEPIKPLSIVTLDAPELIKAAWGANGAVRYCTAKGAKYVIGVELKTGSKWD